MLDEAKKSHVPVLYDKELSSIESTELLQLRYRNCVVVKTRIICSSQTFCGMASGQETVRSESLSCFTKIPDAGGKGIQFLFVLPVFFEETTETGYTSEFLLERKKKLGSLC